MDLVFECMKALMVCDCHLAYPNHNKPFHIYTDDSSYQMGAYIVQDDKPVAFWSCKLNDAQLKYAVGDKELLSMVMVLTKFCTMLLKAVLHIHTYHLNITTNNTTPDCIICWLNYVKHFDPYIHFIPGKENVIAIHSPGSITLKNLYFLKTNSFLSSKTPFPKEWTLLITLFSSNVFCICH